MTKLSTDSLVLLVSQEDARIAFVAAALTGSELTPCPVASVVAAQDRLARGGVAAVLLDAPDVDAVGALGDAVPAPAVIVLTAVGEQAIAAVESLIDAGVQDVMPLPADGAALLRAVRLAIRRQDRENGVHAALRSAGAKARDGFQLLDTTNEALRGPLGGMLAALRLALDDPLLPRQRDRLEALRAAGQGLLWVLDDLRDLVQRDGDGAQPETVAFDLEPLVDSALSQLAARGGGKPAGVTAVIEPDVPRRLTGDPGRLRRLLLALTGAAALAAGRDAARLTVSVENLDGTVVDVRFALSTAGQANVGLDSMGTGGLTFAIVQRLAERLGGRVGVDAAPGSARRVWCVLRYPSPVPAVPASLSVLLVEDNPVGRLVASGFLKAMGHQVTLAEDGAAGLALAAARRFDLIVMDVQMPTMDGHAATRAIRRLDGAAGRVPIVALTAGDAAGDDARCREAGMDACLHKPVSMGSLRAVIAGLWSGAGPPGSEC